MYFAQITLPCFFFLLSISVTFNMLNKLYTIFLLEKQSFLNKCIAKETKPNFPLIVCSKLDRRINT